MERRGGDGPMASWDTVRRMGGSEPEFQGSALTTTDLRCCNTCYWRGIWQTPGNEGLEFWATKYIDLGGIVFPFSMN